MILAIFCVHSYVEFNIPSKARGQVLPSIMNVRVTMPDVALLVTEYRYTPGSLPVTVSVLQ